MYIQKLRLTQFKNHEKSDFEFCAGINCFYGKNGVGKTNILDGLHYLCNGKSYFGRTDTNNIQFETLFALIEGVVNAQDTSIPLSVGLQSIGKKGLTKNGASIPRLADYVGFLPAVMITPGDITLLTANSDERRRYIDKSIGYTNHKYLTALLQHNKLLENRNELLKQFFINQNRDLIALEAIDAQLIPLMDYIHETRVAFISDIQQPLEQVYNAVVEGAETLVIGLESPLNEYDAATCLKMGLNQDLMAQRTTKGTHKADLDVKLNDVSVKKFGSQGQIKSATIALHLAAYLYIRSKIDHNPLLLLDDVFEKIDDDRSARLIKLISGADFGQIFITDTSESRLKSKLKGVATEKKFFNIERL
ncbi:MAG: DNA replication and repair protein RecF [Bacteroidia bacterium]|jgi:DNA replication and repair protein RecF